MSTEEVSTLANSALPYVEACFKKHKKNRGKKLTTKISLGLDRTGRVTAFSEKSSTKKLDTFVLCLNQKLNSANLAVPSDSASGVFDINITLQ
ncbi:MAG: hypothetical protein JWQ35_712 [Bacteriovoracaceae bacterium]|nr:hypothetical protein [Bacteriovoracaceae bacterium]